MCGYGRMPTSWRSLGVAPDILRPQALRFTRLPLWLMMAGANHYQLLRDIPDYRDLYERVQAFSTICNCGVLHNYHSTDAASLHDSCSAKSERKALPAARTRTVRKKSPFALARVAVFDNNVYHEKKGCHGLPIGIKTVSPTRIGVRHNLLPSRSGRHHNHL
jgi:hypothetical protein